jgi:DNA-binding response OmpR family regulator
MQKVLLVEDDLHIQNLAKSKLSSAGYEAVVFGDGTGVLKYVEANHVDLIILDLNLPIIGGKELLLALRRSEVSANVPVIILTIKGLEKDVTELLSLGANDYMRKPFSPSELVARVKALLRRPQTKHP